MPFRKKKPAPDASPDLEDEIAAAEAKLKSEAERLERFLAEEPDRKRRQLEEERRRIEEEASVLEPLEELQDRERERRFDQDLRAGKIRNRRRELAGSLFLTLLLLSALVATAYWVYGVFSTPS